MNCYNFIQFIFIFKYFSTIFRQINESRKWQSYPSPPDSTILVCSRKRKIKFDEEKTGFDEKMGNMKCFFGENNVSSISEKIENVEGD